MSKVVFDNLKGKELVCPLCDEKEKFTHNKIQVIRESLFSHMEKSAFSTDSIHTFECNCGWIMLYDESGKIIKEVWDEFHSGDIVVKKW